MVIWTRITEILKEQSRIINEMATITTATLKTQKKAASNPTVSTPTSSSQRAIDEMLVSEKVNNTLLIQTMNKTLTMLQETMAKMQETMISNHKETNTNIQKLNDKFEALQESATKNEEKIQSVEIRTEKTEKKMDDLDGRFNATKKELEESIIHLERERSAFYLRFENVMENKEEDLGDLMTSMIAEILRRDKNEVRSEIDEIYRIYTNYAKRHNHPREIHIRFARKRVRDLVYMAGRDETITYKGKVIVLKQIPRRVREQRREYKFLTNLLNKKNIPFRWLIPEGILMTWEGKRTRIENIEKATEIFDQIRGEEEEMLQTDDKQTSEKLIEQEKEKEKKEEEPKEKEEQTKPKEARTRAQKANKQN